MTSPSSRAKDHRDDLEAMGLTVFAKVGRRAYAAVSEAEVLAHEHSARSQMVRQHRAAERLGRQQSEVPVERHDHQLVHARASRAARPCGQAASAWVEPTGGVARRLDAGRRSQRRPRLPPLAQHRQPCAGSPGGHDARRRTRRWRPLGRLAGRATSVRER